MSHPAEKGPAAVDPRAFIVENTALRPVPLVPELSIWVADEATDLWEATEATLNEKGLDPPYWAFCWPGGQALARWILDEPTRVAGKRVLDFGAGSGIVGIAAARAGAAHVLAADTDRFAGEAMRLNAEAAGVTIDVTTEDVIGTRGGWEVVFAGDVCYERPMAERVIAWLRALAAEGVLVVVGDPGRTYLPKDGLTPLAEYTVPTSLALEDRTARETRVLRLTAVSDTHNY